MNLRQGNLIVKIRAMIIIIVLQFVFGDYLVVQATTKLIWRLETAVNGKAVPGYRIPALGGKQVSFTSIDVSPYRSIRIIASQRTDSVSRVAVRLKMIEGTEAVGELDPIILNPGSNQTNVFDVPGTRLEIIAEPQAANGWDTIDILIYGSD